MNAFTFTGGALVALLLSLGSAALLSASSLILGTGLALRIVLLLVVLGYWFWLLSVTSARAGISLMAASWLLLMVLLVMFNPPFLIWLATCAFLLWLQRSALRYQRPVQVLADAGLSLLALCAAVATYVHTSSFFLSCWSFFLLQAACAFIPASTTHNSTHHSTSDRFTQARDSAEKALRRLRQSSSH